MTPSDDTSRGFGRRREGHRVTFVHGETVRAIHIDTGWLMAGAATVAAFALAWAGASGWLYFRDDVLAGAASRQVRLERAYEDRVATLRAEIDRINGRQLIDQDAFEAKIDQLVERQKRLDETQARIGGLIGKAGDVGLKMPAAVPGAGLQPLGAQPATGGLERTEPQAAPPAPPPLDTDRFATPLRSSGLLPFVTPAAAGTRSGLDPARAIASVERRLDTFEQQQKASLDGLVQVAEKRGQVYSRVLGRLGFRVADTRPQQPRPRPGADGVGGPFVPLTDAASRADEALTRLAQLTRAASVLPLARPLPGNPAVTSGFGSRLDPFLGVPALHTGIDFRAEMGEGVRVTGAGLVVGSGRQGGYGLCVDVDHGNGVVTRYGHLSGIAVTNGQKVKTGDVIGWAGSTGRSTATHLHYETRVAGEPVDPTSWLEAGRELGL